MASILSESSDDEREERPGFGINPKRQRMYEDYSEDNDDFINKKYCDEEEEDNHDHEQSYDLDNENEHEHEHEHEHENENDTENDNDNDNENYNENDNENDEDDKTLELQEEKFKKSPKKNFAERIMMKMGYREGKGLGKDNQGIVEPIKAFNQKGKRGLGHDNKKLVEAKLKWDPLSEEVSVKEPIEWLENEDILDKNVNELNEWLITGKFKDTLEDETLFCDNEIVKQVVNSKSVFDNLDKHEMRRARSRSNPYETIRGAFFLNRAAVKMANIDKACDFMFTSPKNHIDNNELLYFADVCAGPGGFSEYVLWRKKWHAKGFGFTLKDSNDFKLEDFYAASPETFHPFYGPKDDGNVYDPDNQLAFRDLIMKQTQNRGVHFMMSDGGFSVEGSENIQEILSKQLYLCQCLVALMIVRPGGNFVTKLFDLFTPFSAGLIYLMYRCFKRISIFKPNTSRPANSERYLICNDKLTNIDNFIDYLQQINNLLLLNDKDNDVLSIVPNDVLFYDRTFYQYLKESNEFIGKKQIGSLLKIAAYTEDTTLVETRQSDMRKECLEYWNLPDQSRTIPRNFRPEERLKTIVGSLFSKLFELQPTFINVENINKILNTPCDWFCVPCGNYEKNCTFYFSMGRTKVYKFVKNSWERVEERIELPADTLVYAEMVNECRGQYKILRRINALHIIDAWFLGCEDISQQYLPNRYELIKKFCESLWKPENKDYLRVRPKLLHRLDSNIKMKFNLEKCILKNGTNTLGLFSEEPFYSQNDDKHESFFFTPNNILFIKCTVPPWSVHWSRTYNYHYLFNCKTNKKEYEDKISNLAVGAIANFSKTFETRIIWNWPNDNSINISELSEKIFQKCPSYN